MEAMSGGSPGAVSLPLQFRSASPGIEIWTGSQNTSPPGWVDPKGADVERNLLIEGAFSGVEECPLRALQFGPSSQLSYSGSALGSLATIDDGSTTNTVVDLGSSRTVRPGARCRPDVPAVA